MSSIAQDELGHAAALYGLLGGLTGDRPGRPRLRSRAGRVPPLPAARPRSRRLGDDDRPALPVRHRPMPCGSRRWPTARGRRWPSSSASCCARSATTGCTRARGWSGWPGAQGEPRERLLAALDELCRGRGDRLHAARRRGGAGRRRDPGRADDRARGALAGGRSRRRSRLSTCRCHRPRPRPGPRPSRPRRAVPTGCGASSRASVAPTPERPGERGRHAGRDRAAPCRRGRRQSRPAAPAPVDEAAVRAALAEVMDPELPMLSVVDLGIVHRVEVDADRGPIRV